MTDTDSLFYEIKTEDIFKDLFGNNEKWNYKKIKDFFSNKLVDVKDFFDVSNFKQDSIYFWIIRVFLSLIHQIDF